MSARDEIGERALRWGGDRVARLDAALATRTATEPGMQTVMRARASTLSLSEALDQHAVYFGTGAQG